LRKIWKLGLVAISLIYISFVICTFFDYHIYVSTMTAKYEQRGIPPGYIDLDPYSAFWYAKPVVFFGLVIVGLYLINLAVLIKKRPTILATQSELC